LVAEETALATPSCVRGLGPDLRSALCVALDEHLLECRVRLPDIMPAGCVCECVGELGGNKWEKLTHFVHDVLRVVAQLHPCPLETQAVVRISSRTSPLGLRQCGNVGIEFRRAEPTKFS